MYLSGITDARQSLALLGILSGFLLFCGSEAGGRSDSEGPKVNAGHDLSALSWPRGLLRTVRASFPDMRIPVESDQIDSWSDQAVAGSVPFMRMADFDGNEMADVALILLGLKEWKIVVFLQAPAEKYRGVVLMTRPIGAGHDAIQRWHLAVRRKGVVIEQLGFDEETEEQRVVARHKLPHDALEVVHLGAGSDVYRWTGQGFEAMPLSRWE